MDLYLQCKISIQYQHTFYSCRFLLLQFLRLVLSLQQSFGVVLDQWTVIDLELFKCFIQHCSPRINLLFSSLLHVLVSDSVKSYAKFIIAVAKLRVS
uniref:Uncharacterized protein n=1 Tax=Salix viminalis TaxID=40686 RepID=A0A6N2MJR6_SALVM